MRKIVIAPNEYYHLYNRGVNKQDIFHNDRDRARFLFLILHFQSTVTFTNIEYYVSHFMRHRVFNISKKSLKNLCENKLVEVVNFCLMPNHFHLLIFEKTEGGIAQYMQRVLNAYTKYYNTKYKKSGHLFQGPYQAVHVYDNAQLLHLSAYIHRNSIDLLEWRSKISEYPWSSLGDYVGENRWHDLLSKEIISEQFPGNDYAEFIESSSAKSNKDTGTLFID